MLCLSHKSLDVWKLGIDVVTQIYSVTKNFPKYELFALTIQLRRAAVSVPSNIAEGCSRSSISERRRFFEIARSSLVEIDTQVEIALSLGYLNEQDLKTLDAKFQELFAKLSKLVSILDRNHVRC